MRLFGILFFITLVGVHIDCHAIPAASGSAETSHFQDFTDQEKKDLEAGTLDITPWHFVTSWTSGNILKKETIENDLTFGGAYQLPGHLGHPWSFEVLLNPTLKWAEFRVERFQYWRQFRGQDLHWGIYALQGIDPASQLAMITEIQRLKIGLRVRADNLVAGLSLGLNGYEFHIGLDIPVKF